MYCKKCGKQLNDTDKFCPACGASTDNNRDSDRQFSYTQPDYFDIPPQSQRQDYYSQQPSQQQSYQYGTQQQQKPAQQQESNLCAILGFIFSFFVPIVGLVLSIMGRQKRQYRELATAGMVISIISIVLSVILVICYTAMFVYMGDEIGRYLYAFFR